ncbi:hypothetical protein BD289DRAFT_220347 [Coniella lustricola]|uniref:Uncharacterized protein n=1 Tax=Coniella lustricola TaxID=2025994 RepID=A0A2T3ALQ4_9PEZI|nr:hypothetical protein BD289DRAFT_220347 [Coniella lustricola]
MPSLPTKRQRKHREHVYDSACTCLRGRYLTMRVRQTASHTAQRGPVDIHPSHLHKERRLSVVHTTEEQPNQSHEQGSHEARHGHDCCSPGVKPSLSCSVPKQLTRPCCEAAFLWTRSLTYQFKFHISQMSTKHMAAFVGLRDTEPRMAVC